MLDGYLAAQLLLAPVTRPVGWLYFQRFTRMRFCPAGKSWERPVLLILFNAVSSYSPYGLPILMLTGGILPSSHSPSFPLTVDINSRYCYSFFSVCSSFDRRNALCRSLSDEVGARAFDSPGSPASRLCSRGSGRPVSCFGLLISVALGLHHPHHALVSCSCPFP